MTEAAKSYSRFVRLYWRRLHLVAQRYARSEADAQDLVQETVTRAWEDYNPSEAHAYRGGWLFVILRRIAAEWARRARRRIHLVPVDHDELTELMPSDVTAPFEALPPTSEDQFREFLDDKIVAAFDSLDPAYREIVLLSVAGDLSYREIAEILACPIGTVMSRMARARRSLRVRLADFAKTKGWETSEHHDRRNVIQDWPPMGNELEHP